MKNWIKIGDDIIECVKSEHQFTIDNKLTTSHFTIDIKGNNYFNIIFDLYDNKKTFDWEDNKSRGSGSNIKSIDIFNDILTCQIRSNDFGIKDKSYERNKRLEQILPDDKTSDENDNIINYFVTKIKY